MTRLSKSVAAAAVIAALAVTAVPQGANAEKPIRTNPVGAGWDSKVQQSTANSGQALTAEQIAAIDAVNSYFNRLTNLQGRFEKPELWKLARHRMYIH